MKNLMVLIAILLLPVIAFSQTNEQTEKLKMLKGNWKTDLSSFKSSIQGFTEWPDQKIKCEELTDGSLMCKYFTNNGSGDYTITGAELFAYNQATNKIYNMIFEGPSVNYGNISFDGNLMTWVTNDLDGNTILSGTMQANKNSLEYNGKMAGTEGDVSITYVREE